MKSKWLIPIFSIGLSFSQASWADKLDELIQQAEQGDAKAQTDLGSRYAEGDGVPIDFGKAEKWFKSAAEKGNPLAEYNMGLMFARGEGVSQPQPSQTMVFKGR